MQCNGGLRYCSRRTMNHDDDDDDDVLHVNRKVHMACNFNCLMETYLSHRKSRTLQNCKCGKILEMVQDRDVVVTREH